MQIQKFIGDSMPVVLSNLKDALGSDAIILANRRVGDHIEVIATGILDETEIENAQLFNTDTALQTAETPADLMVAASGSHQMDTQNKEPVKPPVPPTSGDQPKQHNNKVSDLSMQTCKPCPTPIAESAIKLDSGPLSGENSLKRDLASPEDLNQQIASTLDAAKAELTESISTRINQELQLQLDAFSASMKQRLSQLEVNMWGEKDPVKSKHLQSLMEIGLGAELAVALVNRVDSEASYDDAVRQSLVDLANTLPVAFDRTLTHDGVTFITGPNGAGKTTTLLKLAAQKVQMSGADSLVLICTDAKRIGVFESLAAHGSCFGIPVVCARSQAELQELLLSYAHKDLVLVDQQFSNELENDIAPANEIIDSEERSVRHLLVLPATIQTSVAESVVSLFKDHPSARCVITNLDRPCRVGQLFTTLIRNNLRVSYWSECNDIHKPLNQASAQTLVASAIAMAKRLEITEDERYLMDLIHPRTSMSVVPMFSHSL